MRNGEYARVRQLADNGVALNQIFEGQSLLAVAAQNGHFLLVYELQERHVPFKSNTQLSLIDCAVMANEIEFLRDHYQTAKNLKALALIAIKYSAKECLIFLLKKMERKTCQSNDLLLAAIAGNDENSVKILLKYSNDINLPLDTQGNTPAHITVMHGAHRILPLLIESGAAFLILNKKNQTPYHLAVHQKDDDFLERLLKLTQPEDWPHDLWELNDTELNKKMIGILSRYKKQLPEKTNKIQTIPSVKETRQKKTIKQLSPCPILTAEEHKLLKIFKSCLRDADYDYATTLLEQNPVLMKILKSEKGGSLLQLLFENLSDLASQVQTEEEEKEEITFKIMELIHSTMDTFFILLREQGINPAHYIGKYNVFRVIMKAETDKQACYKFDTLAKYFPESLSILANDKLDESQPGMAELSLIMNKMKLFEKLDMHCQKEMHDDTPEFYGLHYAVTGTNYGLVQRMLKRYPVDSVNTQGQTPLMLAAKDGNAPLVNLLLKQGAFIDKCDTYGRNILHYALDDESLETVLLVLPLLKKPNQSDRFGVTPMMKAAFKGCISVMQFLCETNHDIHAVDQEGHNALHHATIAGQIECIKFLLQQKFIVDQPEMPSEESMIATCLRRTPLHLAALYKQESAVFELLRLGANPDQEDVRGFTVCEYGILSKNKIMQDVIKRLPSYHNPKRNQYLLHAAVIADQTTIIGELILSEANQNAVNDIGRNALHIASIYNSGDAANLLLKGGSIVFDAIDKIGHAPIHYAAQYGHVRLITLLGAKGADLDQKSTTGESPLTLASLHDQEGAIAALLQQGADFTQLNSQGMTPAQIALLKGYFPIVHLLQEAGDNSLKVENFSSLPEKEQPLLKSALTKLTTIKPAKGNHLMRFYKPYKKENIAPIQLENKSLKI